MAELRLLTYQIPDRVREDLIANGLLICMNLAFMSRPDVGLTQQAIRQIWLLQQGLMVLGQRALVKWKPKSKQNQALRAGVLADLKAHQTRVKQQKAAQQVEATQQAEAAASDTTQPHCSPACDNKNCQRTDCPRHNDRWN